VVAIQSFCTAVAFISIFTDPAVRAGFSAKVTKKPNLELRRAAIAEELSRSSRVEVFGGFDLDQDFVVDDHVHYLRREWCPAKVHGDRHLSIDPMTHRGQQKFTARE